MEEEVVEKMNIKISSGIKELKEAEDLYEKCLYLTKEDLKLIEFPALKYFSYTVNLIDAFENRVDKMITNIKNIQKKNRWLCNE
jgi:hypothetical protein